MARLLTTLFDTPTHMLAPQRRWFPALDLVETGDHYEVFADLPGLRADDVSIDVADGVLTISGERTISRQASDGGYMRLERPAGQFARSLTLPKGIDAERIEASFSDGVLAVRIPKPEERRPHRVQITPAESLAAVEA